MMVTFTLATCVLAPFAYPELGHLHDVALYTASALLAWLTCVSGRTLVGVVHWVWICQRKQQTDWRQETADFALSQPVEARSLTHPVKAFDAAKFFVVLPNYKEPLDVLRLTLRKLAETCSSATGGIAKEQVVVVLAMEEREGREDAHMKVEVLEKEFASEFHDFVATHHPADLPGEHPGKGPNLQWALNHIQEWVEAEKYGWHEEDVLVTVLDADSFVDPQFLPHVAYAFCTRWDRHALCYTPAMVATSNLWNVPSIARIFQTFTIADEVASSCGYWDRLPFSTFAYSLPCLRAIGGGDARRAIEPDVLAEDHHLYLKMMVKVPGANMYSTALPCLNFSCGDSKDTYLGNILDRRQQAIRHMFGINEVIYYYDQLSRLRPTWRQLCVLLRITHIHLLSIGAGAWVRRTLHRQPPLLTPT
jgi:cellulose synthase/poly-beta-1,6-N-acetylglucosamine synthase-like glycosyltransferase